MFVRQRLCLFVFLLSLCLAGSATAQYSFYHFGRNKIQYEDFDWHVLKTEHFNVYYYPEMRELAEHGAHFAEEAYDELQNRFTYSLNRRVPLIFYSSNLHFKQTNVTPGFIPDGVGGFFEFLKGRVVIPSNGDLHRFRRVVRHELVHVFTYARLARVMRDHRETLDHRPPLWFTEGLAEYWSGGRDYDHEMVIRDALFSNYLVPLDDMHRIRGTFQMYKQGETLFHFIAETYGEEKILQLIDSFWKEASFQEIMEQTLHEDADEIDRRWQQWLKERYYPMLDDAQVPSLVAKGISTQGFSAKPAFYQFSDGTRKVYFLGNRDGYTNVYQVTVDSAYRPTGDPEVLVHGERDDRFEAFHLFESRISTSADGKLAFVTKSGGRDVIHVYNLRRDEMGPSYRFEDQVAVYSPTWSPDGEELAFTAISESGFSDLYVYNTQADQLRRLTQDVYDDRDPSWSPDGERLAFTSDRTSKGQQQAYNLFTYNLGAGTIDYVTYGPHRDFSPRWGPDGRHLVFTSARRDSAGRYGAQNVWVADMPAPPSERREVATASASPDPLVPASAASSSAPTVQRLTNLTTAAFDPVWTPDDRLLFTAFEHGRFTIRQMDELDSLRAAPRERDTVEVKPDREQWAFARVGLDDGAERVSYEGKYSLDVAQGQVSQNPIWGTSGGAVLAFSDMLGNDYWYFTLYNTGRSAGSFLENLSFQISRVQLKQRANIAYGVQRFSGLRYDVTDPVVGGNDLAQYREQLYGGFGAVSYPLSKFRRLELNTSLNWSRKEYIGSSREALLLSNSVSLVHDNALYGLNGPVDGWRANLTGAYTLDVAHPDPNVNYYTLSADVRNYFRLMQGVTFASRGLVQMNRGRRARLFVLGGSWDLRGFRLFDVRGQKMWFTTHELRFPILERPYLFFPPLRIFGVTNLRGALFVDAAHAWNEDYSEWQPQLKAGETIGSTGIGFRMNLFGGLVLRYDIGYRYRDGFRQRIDDGLFKQFFFGYDF